MATRLLSSPSESLQSARLSDTALLPAAPEPLADPNPLQTLTNDVTTVLKSRRRHRIPVISLAARDLSLESIKLADVKSAEPLKSDVAHLLDMGMHFFRKGMEYEAVSLYRQALTHAPDSALGHYLLGIALKSLKQADDARRAWKAAIASHELGAEASWARERAALLLSRV